MDGWLGDLVIATTCLCAVVGLVLVWLFLESTCRSFGRHDDIADWQQHLENQRTQMAARHMVREIKEEEDLNRMWRIS